MESDNRDRSKVILERYGEVEIAFKAYFKGECVYSGVAHSGRDVEAVIYTDDDKQSRVIRAHVCKLKELASEDIVYVTVINKMGKVIISGFV